MSLKDDYTTECALCGDLYPLTRKTLAGYDTCMSCGEREAVGYRNTWCVAPMNKSNYMLVTDPTVLRQLNPKRTT